MSTTPLSLLPHKKTPQIALPIYPCYHSRNENVIESTYRSFQDVEMYYFADLIEQEPSYVMTMNYVWLL
jgi:hypothetical protein